MYINSFEEGDIVTPLRPVTFMAGSKHLVGINYTIKQDEIAYYNIMGRDYKLVEDRSNR